MTVDPQLVTRKLTLILADLGTVHELALAVIDRSVAEHLAPSAGLRNRLVQEYDEIDPAQGFDAISRAEADVFLYAEGIETYLSTLIERPPPKTGP